MLHIDLFSGIGGFALAADQVWDNVEHIFCDNDKFCQAVLKKHWPESKIYGDIKQFDSDTFNKGLERRKQIKRARQPRQSDRARAHQKPFILTGGFPCQPFSAAGLRRGTTDGRYLWPEMLRVIRLTEPQWVIAENVGGLVTWNEGLVLETVCTDLEAAGYEVQPFIIPAVAVGAPHRRDRIWFVANRRSQRRSDGRGDRQRRHILPNENGNAAQDKPQRQGWQRRSSPSDAAATDAPGEQHQARMGLERQPYQEDAEFGSTGWERNWFEVAAELCSMDDGVPARMGGTTLSKTQHRNAQIKAYGNAIVPQVAMEIMRAIAGVQLSL